MANRLASSTSPYLQQHADNPVAWWEWGDEAFAEARRRGVPVLLSIGYAACHWCHVMAHESFQDQEVGRVLSQDYVAIKVDREERPDVDAVYMTATTALTGHGGWPMTCVLTPEAEPFWAGTYLPRENFLQLLTAVTQQWRTDRERLEQGARQIVTALQEAETRVAGRPDGPADGASVVPTLAGLGAPEDTDPPAVDLELLTHATRSLADDYDHQHGGFGRAPKFPPSMVLAFLLRHHGRTGDPSALQMVRGTCEAMARSGTYDQLGGGFARYGVDRQWVVPHFEKMLYDNALLLGVYADLARADATSRPWAERVVRETVAWLLDEMWTEQAAFASSLDADTDGVEGLTYVWTPEELRQSLGEEDGARAAALLGVTEEGTFEHGASTLQLRADPEDPAWWASVRERLLLRRTLRPQPARDDKVVTAWNGLAIASLAHAGWLLEEPDWVDVAARCARFLLSEHLVDGRLRRSSRDGQVGAALGVAEDYGNLADGLLALHRATGETIWMEQAGVLLDQAVELFGEPDGSFAATGHDAEQLVLTPQFQGDNAEPGGLSAISLALVRHGVQAGRVDHLARAGEALDASSALLRRAPRFAGWALTAAEELATGPALVRLSPARSHRRPARSTGPDERAPASDELGRAARHTPVGTLVVDGDASISLTDGARAAVVCHGTTCGLPRTDPAQLSRLAHG
ncbi:thioredoxin domain-containing protein [Ornithinimicrobium pratense]|uniref:Thioredoxin domain-containing protein n=1 Tax=Ornithinimicrobium pratense TaxID=2593973 RepID=A0A5J6V743_9MICO|nr:thioredoxin domain-containing protein [Ornithinimicrobium pratense]QFG68931.1 thioredoxin domain-containing protein [Ornithinimicrobium pratense]